MAMVQLSDLASSNVLKQALVAVLRKNKGKSLYDPKVQESLNTLQESLLNGSYQPRPAERFYLPKHDGTVRPIVRCDFIDSIALTALRLVLRRLFAKTFSSASFAYHEERGAFRAVKRGLEYVVAGRDWVLKTDIDNCFDSISHRLLLARLEPFFTPDVLALIERLLRYPVQDQGEVTITERGLIQGSPASPILSNIYLTPLDNALHSNERGLVRFADDFAVFCASAKYAGEALEITQDTLAGLELRVERSKTLICSVEQGFDFLGFRFQDSTVRVSPERLEAFKFHVETHLNPGLLSPESIKSVNDLIIGWRNYFKLGEVSKDFRDLEVWLGQRYPEQRGQLERLLPFEDIQLPTPVLGDYDKVRRTVRREQLVARRQDPQTPYKKPAAPRKQKPLLPKTNLAMPCHVSRDDYGLPVTVRKDGETFQVAALPTPQQSDSNDEIEFALERAGLYHRALAALRWKTQLGKEAASACAAALSQRIVVEEAWASYDEAFLQQSNQDLRMPRGMVRRVLRLECWTALLEAGLLIGKRNSEEDFPALVLDYAEMFEPCISDHTVLWALQLGELRNPVPAFYKNLHYVVPYKDTRRPWFEILRLEALVISTGLANKTRYEPWLWGAD
jgi:group II intron reverse transcriptase/maturase